MDQVSRPFQVVLVVTLLFAAVWFVALRPKSGGGGSSAPAPAPAPQSPPAKSAIPGGLGSALDKARAAKVQGDAAANTRSTQVDAAAGAGQNTTATPVQQPPAVPVTKARKASGANALAAAAGGAVSSGAIAMGTFGAAVERALGAGSQPGPAVTVKHAAGPQPAFATPGKVRSALRQGHAVVLLFFSPTGSDDRAVRGELASVSRRGGRVNVWAVSIRGLARFKNSLQGAEVLQDPTVVVMSRSGAPVTLAGYTDHAEIDQAAAVALRHRR